jgi:hypothetical protein
MVHGNERLFSKRQTPRTRNHPICSFIVEAAIADLFLVFLVFLVFDLLEGSFSPTPRTRN